MVGAKAICEGLSAGFQNVFIVKDRPSSATLAMEGVEITEGGKSNP